MLLELGEAGDIDRQGLVALHLLHDWLAFKVGDEILLRLVVRLGLHVSILDSLLQFVPVLRNALELVFDFSVLEVLMAAVLEAFGAVELLLGVERAFFF